MATLINGEGPEDSSTSYVMLKSLMIIHFPSRSIVFRRCQKDVLAFGEFLGAYTDATHIVDFPISISAQAAHPRVIEPDDSILKDLWTSSDVPPWPSFGWADSIVIWENNIEGHRGEERYFFEFLNAKTFWEVRERFKPVPNCILMGNAAKSTYVPGGDTERQEVHYRINH